MNPKILCLFVSIFTIVWATPKRPQEKGSGGPSRNQQKFNHSKQSVFNKVVPKSPKKNEAKGDQTQEAQPQSTISRRIALRPIAMDQTTEQQNVVALQQQPYQVQQSHNQQPQPVMPQQQSQLQNQYQQQLKTMNFLAQLEHQSQQLQSSPTQIQLESIQRSVQREQQSPQPMAQHQQLAPSSVLLSALMQQYLTEQQQLQQQPSSSSMPQQQLTHQLYNSQPLQQSTLLVNSASASVPSFALPEISDQLLPVNLAVNETATSNNRQAVSLRKQYQMIVGIVKKAAMKSISIIQLSLKNYGFDGPPELFGGLNFLNAEHASKMATAINVVKVAETNTAQFVIDQMKKENADSPQITQILEEIGEESADFERHMKAARTANWEVVRKTNFLLAFARLYNKLFILLNNAFEPNAPQGEKREFKQLLDWTEKMKNEIYKKLRDLLNANDEASKWCIHFFRLTEAIETAKVAFLIALPMSSTNEWIKNGFGWSVLDKIMLSRIKLEESLECCYNKSWIGSNYMGLIRKHTGYAAKNNIKFSDYALNKLGDLLSQIVLSINPLIERRESNKPKQAKLCNLVLFSALFRKLIADFETPDYDVIWLTKLREERKSALKILKQSVLLLDAKFTKEFERISKLDRIRTGILDGEGSNSK